MTMKLIVSQICENNQKLGVVIIWGMLKSKDIYISRQRLRDSLKRIDMEGIERRKKRALKRRVYSVHHANYVWHIDGYHKLIRLKLKFNKLVFMLLIDCF